MEVEVGQKWKLVRSRSCMEVEVRSVKWNDPYEPP